MKRDLDEIAAIEKAIAQKYGKETIQDPRASWDEDKEKELEQSDADPLIALLFRDTDEDAPFFGACFCQTTSPLRLILAKVLRCW